MKKKLMYSYIFLLTWLLFMVFYTIDIYTTIKYEIETIANDTTIEKVYLIADRFLFLNLGLFVICLIVNTILFFAVKRDK